MINDALIFMLFTPFVIEEIEKKQEGKTVLPE